MNTTWEVLHELIIEGESNIAFVLVFVLLFQFIGLPIIALVVTINALFGSSKG